MNDLIEGVDQEIELKGFGKTNNDHMKRIEYELAIGTEDTGKSPLRKNDFGEKRTEEVV